MPKDYEKWTEELDEIDPFEDDEKPPPSEKDYAYCSRGNQYNQNAGSQSFTKGRCNALLVSWEDRYGEPRYCTRIPEKYYKCDGNSDFCKKHKGREGLMQHASDVLEHGLGTKTFAHYFDKTDPVEQVYITALYEKLLEESKYDFECEKDSLIEDFDESDFDTVELGITTDEDNIVEIAFPQPTEHPIRGLALLEAAIDEVKMLKANGRILQDDLRSESPAKVATTEGGKIGETYDTWNEHYLNLAYSRLVKDQKENLKRGGVDIEGVEAEDTSDAERDWDVDLPTKDEVKHGENFQDENTEKVIDLTEVQDEVKDE